LVSIISVTLGVATMVVVNSVMEGFTSEMQNRIHGILSDISFIGRDANGFRDADWHMEQIRRVAGDSIESMTPTVFVPAMLQYQYQNQNVTLLVDLVGIDANTKNGVGDFGKYLQHPGNRAKLSWDLRDGGYDVRDHQDDSEAAERPELKTAGWEWRRWQARLRASQILPPENKSPPNPADSTYERRRNVATRVSYEENDLRTAGRTSAPQIGSNPPVANQAGDALAPQNAVETPVPQDNQTDPFSQYHREATQGASANNPSPLPEAAEFNPATQQHTGAVMGISMAYQRVLKNKDKPREGVENRFFLLPGDDVKLTFPTVSVQGKASYEYVTIVDFYESKMSEYDSKFIFMPIRKLQQSRGMIDPTTGIGNVNAIQIKLRPGADGNAVRDKLKAAFPNEIYRIETWRDQQTALLSAVELETIILNIILFLIIAVAAFGILAIFLMIVVEKTKDIGILKSLGASSYGVMGIFLSYGLALGLIGSGVGLACGLLFVHYINNIADGLAWVIGRRVFDPTVYYFYKIPTIVVPHTIAWIVLGAVGIAVAASILPALRAARLHPVEALRYE
jgi:lipoprotein-releasing system permease protein